MEKIKRRKKKKKKKREKKLNNYLISSFFSCPTTQTTIQLLPNLVISLGAFTKEIGIGFCEMGGMTKEVTLSPSHKRMVRIDFFAFGCSICFIIERSKQSSDSTFLRFGLLNYKKKEQQQRKKRINRRNV